MWPKGLHWRSSGLRVMCGMTTSPIGHGAPLHGRPLYPTTHSPSPLGRLIRHTIFELRVHFQFPPLPYSFPVVVHLGQARNRLALETPWFLHQLCLHFPNLTITFDPHPCGLWGSYTCAVPSSWKLSHRCPSITFPREALTPASQPPLYINSQPCIPPCIGLITFRAYLHGYLTHVSLCQVANSTWTGAESVLLTDNPQCLARSIHSLCFFFLKRRTNPCPTL